MPETGHEDYSSEADNLEFTKKYMDIVIRASESNEEQFRENLKQSLEGMDMKDSSFSYLSMLTNSSLLRRTEDEVKKLKRFENKPYFARIDFLREETDQKEKLYIGKVSLFDKETQLPIIVDWRSPVASLYYDGRLGEVIYEAQGEEYSGCLTLKRQLLIENGRLEEIRDVDLTTNDELLQMSLAESASNRLSDIVATIQEEQNQIIRADLNKPIIVQGAAGSGKTTIALHRISYFIYTYAEHFSPHELMILAPNRLFIDYISEVLPELGVESILQTTFVDYVKKCINKKIRLRPPNEKLSGLMNDSLIRPELVLWLSEYKGSLAFRDVLDRYLDDILESLIPKEDFYIDKFKLYTAVKIRRLMKVEYQYLPYFKRIEKVKKVLQNYVRTEKKRMLEKVAAFYDDKLEKALYSKADPEKRKRYITKALDKKQEAIASIQKDSRTGTARYINKLPKHDIFHYYEVLVTDPVLLAKYAGDSLTPLQISYFCEQASMLRSQSCYEQEDLAALLYLQGKLFGIDSKWKVRNIVIDEAQDYSYFQLFALKSSLETDMFTIVGDLAQGIHSYRGIKDWGIVCNEIFPRASYRTLQKSYRTTVEIMEAANAVLKLLQLELPSVEPVVRHGSNPEFHYTANGEVMAAAIDKKVEELRREGIQTVALIGKTERECKKAGALLKTHTQMPFQLLKENEEISKDKIVIVNSQLSKGLEFDAVLIFSLEEGFHEKEIDIKLLYVSMTRPLHRLFFFGISPERFLISGNPHIVIGGEE